MKNNSSNNLFVYILLIILSASISSVATFYVVSKTNNREVFKAFDAKEMLLQKADKIDVKLFFLKPESGEFAFEYREIICDPSMLKNIRKTLDELLIGSKTELLSVIPEGTQLINLFLDNDNNLYLNFNDILRENHPCGFESEYQTIFSLFNTVYSNFGNINKIEVLINGEIAETICGHINLASPFEALLDMDMNEGCAERVDDNMQINEDSQGKESTSKERLNNNEQYPTYEDSSKIPLYNPDEDNNTIDESKVDEQ
jgi:hypothetical protein